jgi:hypothetical protein
MENMPMQKPPMGEMPKYSAGPAALALIWSAPWLVVLTVYFTLNSWRPHLAIFAGAKPGFITIFGITLFALTFLAVWTLNKKGTTVTGSGK